MCTSGMSDQLAPISGCDNPETTEGDRGLYIGKGSRSGWGGKQS